MLQQIGRPHFLVQLQVEGAPSLDDNLVESCLLGQHLLNIGEERDVRDGKSSLEEGSARRLTPSGLRRLQALRLRRRGPGLPTCKHRRLLFEEFLGLNECSKCEYDT